MIRIAAYFTIALAAAAGGAMALVGGHDLVRSMPGAASIAPILTGAPETDAPRAQVTRDTEPLPALAVGADAASALVLAPDLSALPVQRPAFQPSIVAVEPAVPFDSTSPALDTAETWQPVPPSDAAPLEGTLSSRDAGPLLPAARDDSVWVSGVYR